MTIIVENGSGIYGANSGVSVAYITQYLTDRGRETENGWSTASVSAKEAAAIAATQYVELRFGSRIKGYKQFRFEADYASATVSFTGSTTSGETVTIGYTTYTLSDNATATLAASELVALVQGQGDTLVGTVADVSDVVTITLSSSGESGNYTPLTVSGANFTATAFTGGRDGTEQLTTFPRTNLFNSQGTSLSGMRREYLWALCEYAVRAAGSKLAPDPTVDASGKSVQSSKKVVGPIEKTIVYSEGGAIDFMMKPYPEADRLLSTFIGSANGGVMR